MSFVLKRIFDFIGALFAIILLSPILLVVFLMVLFTSPGRVIYWSDRVGKNNVIFKMPKYRSMRLNTPELATDLLQNPQVYLTPVGSFIRKKSLDELPQLWSILKGDMSFVGPRPALFNEVDLIKLRSQRGIDMIIPGLTGWAQVNGRDDLDIKTKVDLDFEYLQQRSFTFDLKILWLTFLKVVNSDGIVH